MRSITKVSAPKFFETHTRTCTSWKQYKSSCKNKLKEHILENEQSYLCIYCESTIIFSASHLEEDVKLSSHIEHIEPKCNSSTLIFEYNNLSVSCDGMDDSTSHNYCGHHKGNRFDSNLFLNPLDNNYKVEDFFSYELRDENKIFIIPKTPDDERAIYTINILNLNHNYLLLARNNAKQLFIKQFREATLENKRLILKKLFSKPDSKKSFLSYLRFQFSSLNI